MTVAARSAGFVSEQAETVLDQLTARSHCNQIAALAIDSVRHGTYIAAIAHRALTPPQKRIETAPRLAAVDGCSGWQGRNVGSGSAPRNVLVVNHLSELVINSACPPLILELGAANNDNETRARTAHNSACPPDVLRRLGSDTAPTVRCAVAAHAVTACDVLEMLSEDSNNDVREAVAANPASPPGMLLRLADGDVFRVGTALTVNPATTPDILARLSGWALSAVRARAAAHVECPVEALRTLSADSDSMVRHQVARNAATPAVILYQMTSDPEEFVRAAAETQLTKPPRWPTTGAVQATRRRSGRPQTAM